MVENKKIISGFSKLGKRGKLKWIVENFFKDPEAVTKELISYWHGSSEQQNVLDGFSENTISNFPMPFGVAPNFIINGTTYCVPMVIEESSVVAAASAAAKFWMRRGGFKAKILGVTKIGQIHFEWNGDFDKLNRVFHKNKPHLLENVQHIISNMEKRGGGIKDMELIDMTDKEPNYYQLKVKFETCDSMGANFINSVLETFASLFPSLFEKEKEFSPEEKKVNVIMAILSNYTPENIVRAYVECPIDDLGTFDNNMDAKTFAYKFHKAVRIATIDPYRATTHNKGIFNGVDAVVIATGNDFRAVEACGHTYAGRDGQYRSLSHCSIDNGVFKFWLDLPFAVGTVGGLTKLHPIAKRSIELLGNPSAEELMMVIGVAGLAQNFAALRSLVTSGIQKGHMKMHLHNMLITLKANNQEIQKATQYFSEKAVSFNAVRAFLDAERGTISKMPLSDS